MVITESMLRGELKNSGATEYEVEKGSIVTPSAKQYLSERNIKLIYKEKESNDTKIDASDYVKKDTEVYKPKYVHINGGMFDKKPEHMTQLNGNRLVNKDHKRIVLRGKLDSLQAKILEVQVLTKELKENKIVKDLEDVLSFVRNILGAEVTEKNFEFNSLIGYNSNELREYSHNPKKYFDTDHIIFPSADMGPVIVSLNSLRAQSREVEISAYQAFKNNDGEPERKDIALALNRLSSCFYVMMCKYKAGKYK